VAVTHKDIHEACIIRDTEAAERVLSAAHWTQRSATGEEPGEPRGSADFRPGPKPSQEIPTMARADRKSSRVADAATGSPDQK